MSDKKKPKYKQLISLIQKHKIKTAIIAGGIVVAIVLAVVFIPSSNVQKSPMAKPIAKLVDVKSITDEIKKVADTKNQEEQAKQEEAVESSVSVQSTGRQKTGYALLDNLINGILNRITNSGMSSNDKLKAIYNYVKGNMHYTMNAPAAKGKQDELKALGYSEYDSAQMTLAFNAATYHQGVCDDYAALTMLLAREAGIPLYQCGGLSSRGSSHAWNILVVNNVKYLIDTNYGIFMKRFSDSGYTEQMDGRNYFNNFKTTSTSPSEKKISWMFNAGYGSQRFMGNNRGEISQNATINRPMYSSPGTKYPTPITPMVTLDGSNNSFSARVTSGGKLVENLKQQSGSSTNYYFSWYPPNPGSYVIEITATSDGIFTGHYTIYANISG